MKKVFGIIFLILATTVLFPVYHYAADSSANTETDDIIRLYMGEIKVIPVNGLARIVIGNPAIADVVNVTKTEMTLNPKAVGTTTLVFWDLYGEQSFTVKVFNENIEEVKRRIDNLISKLDLPEVYTKAEEDEGKILILGSVKTPQDREKISLAIGPLKAKTVDLLAVKELETAIEIDVQVLELDKDATKTLGFTNPLSGTVTLTEVGSAGLTAAWWTKVFNVANVQRGAFTWTLDALVKEGKARILSRPRLACQSGKEAELLVGGEKPIFTTEVASAGGQGTSVEYKEYGIKLKIKPTVTSDNRVKVALNVDISEVQAAESIGSASAPTARAYPLTKRTVSTELYMDDGQTLAIGGLIKQKQEEDVIKTPWLGDLPVFGALFRKKTTKIGGGTGERGNVELFITLTPKIVGEIKDAIAQAKKEAAAQAAAPANLAMENNVPSEMKGYASIIQKRIVENINYPVAAKESGFQGTVRLSLHLSYSGQLLDVVVKESSGYKILDDNAIGSTRKLGTYPPFPAEIEKKDMWIDVPVVYRLD